jgi:hypothetical protein
MRDLEFNEDVLFKNFARMSKTNVYTLLGIVEQMITKQNTTATACVTVFNIFKVSAITCVTFVKRMRHTSALNACKSARVWTQQLTKQSWPSLKHTPKFSRWTEENHICAHNCDGTCKDSNGAPQRNRSQALQLQSTYSISALLYDVTEIPRYFIPH